jgi:hypothetical protein
MMLYYDSDSFLEHCPFILILIQNNVRQTGICSRPVVTPALQGPFDTSSTTREGAHCNLVLQFTCNW